jgi:hypothetical protein
MIFSTNIEAELIEFHLASLDLSSDVVIYTSEPNYSYTAGWIPDTSKFYIIQVELKSWTEGFPNRKVLVGDADELGELSNFAEDVMLGMSGLDDMWYFFVTEVFELRIGNRNEPGSILIAENFSGYDTLDFIK